MNSDDKYARIVYPEPKQVEWQAEILNIDQQVVLKLSAGVEDADFLVETWDNFTCRQIPLSVSVSKELSENSFCLEVNGTPCQPELANKSTYALTVDAKGVAAVAVDAVALKQAWFSMLQMLEPQTGTRQIEGFQLRHVAIQDYPLLKFRSAHLCVFPETTLSFLEKSINLLAMHKFTHVVIEFWGMLKFEALPELSWPQAYSKEEIKPLLQRVRDLGMEPIPMLNHWGHASGSRVIIGRHVVLDQNPLLAPLFEPDGWTWCLTNNETRKLLADIRKELIELFGNVKYFHLGCDEAYSHATCVSCKKHDPAKLLAEYLNSVNDDLKEQGIRPFIWGDALLDSTKWDGYIATSNSQQKTHETLELLSRDFIIADWQYYLKDKKQTATVKHFAEKGFEVVTAPWHDLENIEALGEMAIEQNTFGMMLTTWHTLPMKMNIITRAGSIMWGGEEAGKDNPLYQYNRTSIAAFLRKIRRGTIDYLDAGWRSVEVCENFEA